MVKTLRSTEFFAKLEEATRPAPGRKKGDRTLARIRLATAWCLERKGYIALKASDISDEAGLSEGSFYVYFEDKRQAAVSVLTDFLQEGAGALRDRRRVSNAFEAICNTNRIWVKTAIDHPGLTRSVVQLVDSDSEFAAIYNFHNRQWQEAVTSNVLRRYPANQSNSEISVPFAVVALNAMMNEITRGIFATETYAHLLQLGKEGDSGEELAYALSVIWFRVLYPGIAVPEEKSGTSTLLRGLNDS